MGEPAQAPLAVVRQRRDTAFLTEARVAELGTVTPDHARLCRYIPERMPDLAALREACPFPLAA